MGNETIIPAPNSETPNGTDPQGETPTTTPNGETPGSTTSTPPDDTAKELERLQAAVKRANAEAKENRLAAEELKRLKAEAESATLTAQQKLEKQLADLRSQHDNAVLSLQAERNQSALERAGRAVGIREDVLADALRLVDTTQLEHDEDGRPANAEQIMKELIKTRSWLTAKAPAPTSGGATNPSRTQSDGTGEITASYVADVMSGKIRWQDLTPERRTAVLNWQAQNSYRF